MASATASGKFSVRNLDSLLLITAENLHLLGGYRYSSMGRGAREMDEALM